MTTQNEPSTEIVEPVNDQPTIAGSDESAEGQAQSNELVEPSEESFDNPADYRKAYREYTRKVIADDLKKEYEKKIDGLYHDLKKQRQAKRQMRSEVEEIKGFLMNQRQAPSEQMAEPEPHMYESPQAYAKAYAAYERNIENNKVRAEQQSTAQRQQSAQAVQEDWSGRLQVAASQDPDLMVAVKRVQQEGIGNDIVPEAIHQIMTSPVGPQIYKFLGSNPNIAEEIEDLPRGQQVRAIKLLETQLISGGFIQRTAPQQVQAPQQQAIPPVVAKPVIAPPPAKPAGAPMTGMKKLSDARDMKEYMAIRAQLNKRK